MTFATSAGVLRNLGMVHIILTRPPVPPPLCRNPRPCSRRRWGKIDIVRVPGGLLITQIDSLSLLINNSNFPVASESAIVIIPT